MRSSEEYIWSFESPSWFRAWQAADVRGVTLVHQHSPHSGTESVQNYNTDVRIKPLVFCVQILDTAQSKKQAKFSEMFIMVYSGGGSTDLRYLQFY